MGFVPFALEPAFFEKGQLCKGFLHPLVWLEMDGAGLDGVCSICFGASFFEKGQLCKGFLHPLVWLEMDGAGLDGVCSICFGASFFLKRSAMQGVPPSVSLVRNGWRRFRWGLFHLLWGQLFRKRSAMQGVPPSVSLVRNGWRRFRWGLFHLLWGQLFSKKVSYARGSSITFTWPRTRCVEAYETALRASPVPWLQVAQGLARFPASIWGWPGFVVGFRFVYIYIYRVFLCVGVLLFLFLSFFNKTVLMCVPLG